MSEIVFGLATGRFIGGGNAINSRFLDTNGPANAVSGSYSGNNINIDGVIDALERDGLVTVLAEPNLTALSGETASFLAGGEFPVPVGVDDNEISIEFKEFGVSLAFTPTVLSRERISLKVRPEVSELTRTINVDALREYRDAVGKHTREIVGAFQPSDWDGQIQPGGMDRAVAEGGVPAPFAQAFVGRPRMMVLSGIALFHPAAHFGEATTIRSAGGFGTGI